MHLYTAPSPIHGIGLFTNRQIEKGEAISVVFIRMANTGIFKNDFKENMLGRFTNHSTAPNAVTVLKENQIILEALRAIEPGEEVTVNYHSIIEQFNNDASLIAIVKFW